MNEIFLIGTGGHCKSVIDLIEHENKWRIKGLIGKEGQSIKKLLGYPIVGSDINLAKLHKTCNNAFIAIGQIKSPEARQLISKILKDLNFNSPSIISPFSIKSNHTNIGLGNFIGHGVILNAGSEIKDYCIINSHALIEHDSIINSHCHISTGVIINGGVEIGEGSFIGSGSIIREGIKIPPKSIISAGSRIMGLPKEIN